MLLYRPCSIIIVIDAPMVRCFLDEVVENRVQQ